MLTTQLNGIWPKIKEEAKKASMAEPGLASHYHCTVLKHENFTQSITYILAGLLASEDLPDMLVREVCEEAMAADAAIETSMLEDINASVERDAACDEYLTPLLHYKGYHALQAYRISHWLWQQGRKPLALFFQNRVSEIFDVDIHPAANIGHGIMIDHATGVVIGETTVIENDVSMLHSVTLGGSGCTSRKRHPTIGRGVMIGAGSKILGNVNVGEAAKVAAGSLVRKDVPSYSTVAGVPAKIVGKCRLQPAKTMDQQIPG
ncbi:serine O-acetyltransferase [Sessilibacter corallicola]|uniref:serine O-acetyltransferase n=1 Tax=Sessilibacter corallicola TaxID=2904075 RepID=UPI001E64A2A6|nr:serine O-acetyltransferase [Sessilibacter corallicola]MCE2027056.1 serine O-acetyltransferase [Sessilibacter corallicola]